MTVRELTTGEPGCSAAELTVDWPIYFRYRDQERKDADKGSGPSVIPPTFGGAKGGDS